MGGDRMLGFNNRGAAYSPPAPKQNGRKVPTPAAKDYALVPAADLDLKRLSLGTAFSIGSTKFAPLHYDGKPVFTILRGAPVTIAARTDNYGAKKIDFKLPEDNQGLNIRTLDEWQYFISFDLPVDMGTADYAEWLRYKTSVYGSDVHFLSAKFPKEKAGTVPQVWREDTLVAPEDIERGEEVDVKLSVLLYLSPIEGQNEEGFVWSGGWSWKVEEMKAGPRKERRGAETISRDL